MLPQQEQEILNEFKQGNKDIFAEVYNAYYEVIFKFLIRRTGNAETAYDLTAETFLNAFDKFHRFKWQGVSLKVWLYRIATNKLKNFHRSQKITIHPLEDIPEGLEHMAYDAREELEQVQKMIEYDHRLTQVKNALEQLNPTYQTTVSLKYSAGLSLKEIARSMNRSESAVKSILNRALTQLRAMGLENTLTSAILTFLIL